MKELIAIFLTISLIVTIAPASSFADDNTSQEDVATVQEPEAVPDDSDTEILPLKEDETIEENASETAPDNPSDKKELEAKSAKSPKLTAPAPEPTPPANPAPTPAPAAEKSKTQNSAAAPKIVKKAKTTKSVKVATVARIKSKAVSSSKIRITWSKVKGAKGYKVYRYNEKKKRYCLLKTIRSGKTTALTDKGLHERKKYYYKVSAYMYSGKKIVNGGKSKFTRATTKTSTGSKAVAAAKKKLGCSYRLGRTGPRSFDCSGFVYYVFNKAKVGKVRFSRSTAQGQYNQLRKYRVGSSIKKAKKGDILFFSSSGKTRGIYHTGIYLGNGKVIHAANPRKGVCIGKVKWIPKVCAVVRLP